MSVIPVRESLKILIGEGLVEQLAPARMRRFVGMVESAWNLTESYRPMAHLTDADRQRLHADHREMLMADLAPQMSAAVGVPVIDGVAAAPKTVEALVAMGLRKAGRGEFAAPLPKPYTGQLVDFEVRKPDMC